LRECDCNKSNCIKCTCQVPWSHIIVKLVGFICCWWKALLCLCFLFLKSYRL
jgi:hypothetical protein